MVKKSIALLAASCLAVSGCTSSGGSAPISVASVQQALVNACGYELLASTAATDIAAIASSLVPGGSAAVVTASMIANAICKVAVTPVAPAARLGARGAMIAQPIIVNGVAVHGGFVK